MTKPITPAEVAAAKVESIPPEVYEAFNELIVAAWDSEHRAVIVQDTVVKAVLAKLKSAGMSITRQALFDTGWLDVEDAYRKVGWTVTYEKPAYNETFEATFTFSKKRRVK